MTTDRLKKLLGGMLSHIGHRDDCSSTLDSSTGWYRERIPCDCGMAELKQELEEVFDNDD